jgi:hypothetical protein
MFTFNLIAIILAVDLREVIDRATSKDEFEAEFTWGM